MKIGASLRTRIAGEAIQCCGVDCFAALAMTFLSRTPFGDNYVSMQPFTTLTGTAAPLPMINVDTDMIIPKQFLKTIKRSGLGKSLFYEMRYDDAGNEIESFVLNAKDGREMLLGKMRQGVETMKRTNIKQALVVPGRYNQQIPWDYQTANVVENLRACMEICEPAGLVLVFEPLNPRDHPGLFLTKMAQAFNICRAVKSPSSKILDDMYHQQITEGDLIPNIDACWEELAAFHIGDNPGRKEPTTGEINYKNIFKHIRDKGYAGALCMEHGQSKPGKEGERAVIDAYRACDDF